MLKEHDYNGDKKISFDEFARTAKRRNYKLTVKRSEFKRLAGEDMAISFNEFVKIANNEAPAQQEPEETPPEPSTVIVDQVKQQWSRILNRVDDDRDMKVSYAEMVNTLVNTAIDRG